VICKGLDADDDDDIVFCDTCTRAEHMACHRKLIGSKGKAKLDPEAKFMCGVCLKKRAPLDPMVDTGVVNIGLPAEHHALAMHLRCHTDVMQVFSTYSSPWYKDGNVLKWVGRTGSGGNYSINTDHPLCSTWKGIISRTRTDEHYVKNGVTMYAAWVGTYGLGPNRTNRYDPFAWISWVYYVDRFLGPKPAHGTPAAAEFSMDRINPFLNYEPGNIRWAWVSLQVDNQMHKKSRRFKKRSLKVHSAGAATNPNASHAMKRAHTL
jgi:hypothetical protein